MYNSSSADRVVDAISSMAATASLYKCTLKLDEGASVRLTGHKIDGALQVVECELQFNGEHIVYSRILDIKDTKLVQNVHRFISSYLKSKEKHESFKH